MRHSLIAPLAFVLAIGLAAPLHAADSNPHDSKSQADKDTKLKELEAQKAEFEKLMAEVPQT